MSVRSLLGAAALALAAAAPSARATPSPATADSLSDLPLTVVPARAGAHGDYLAVLLTGDGGVATLDRDLADSITAHGIPVVMLDSRAYLSRKRTPDGAAADLGRVLRHYFGEWGKSRALLIGYSHGADVLPFMVTRLPDALRDSVPAVALLGVAPNANFKFHLVDLISNKHRKDDLMTAPEIEKLRGKKVLCFYGEDEKDSACRTLPPSVSTAVRMPGGHHFGGEYGVIAAQILALVS